MVSEGSEPAARARDWSRVALNAVCDVIEPWRFGTVARSTRYPDYYDFNVVQVEQPSAMTVGELIAFADQALAGLGHRRIDFESAALAEALRPEFEVRGWKPFCPLRMRFGGQPPDVAAERVPVEEVSYDVVHELRVRWHAEDFPGVDATAFFSFAREVALARDARVLAVRRDEAPVAYAQIEHVGDAAEITDVYVRPELRGAGLGTALTSAGVRAAPPVRDLWITADGEGRPQHLYARLGFRPVWRAMQFQRLPRAQRAVTMDR